jgi:hypothetical protein
LSLLLSPFFHPFFFIWTLPFSQEEATEEFFKVKDLRSLFQICVFFSSIPERSRHLTIDLEISLLNLPILSSCSRRFPPSFENQGGKITKMADEEEYRFDEFMGGAESNIFIF